MNIEKILKKLNIEKEHKGKIEEIQKYVQEHRVNELFNVRNRFSNDSYKEL
jgi:hypothetical protein